MGAQGTGLLPLLKQYFGFDSFLPFQAEIVEDCLAGRDVLAVLPTGGGKSLCFQLPAMARAGLTVVVSPLIALMKDQVDGLVANGLPATFLASSLEPEESWRRLRGLHTGEYRLVYVSPERLMMPGFLSDLQRRPLNLLAIDEAHCISEWGHHFRPEYRQLASLRDLFPAVPLMALTATATERVRQDIVTLLKLRQPRCYIASFDRPNLTYRVLAKTDPREQLLAFVRARPSQSGIVYCQTRRTAEDLAAAVRADGIKARPYHSGLPTPERTRNQDLFQRDETQVICATIAFGMGIDKPDVRFVAHYDLPRTIEHYHQETGRAGRDGLPSDCALFYCAADLLRQFRLIETRSDLKERRIARAQLLQMARFAHCFRCRRGELLRCFGEEPRERNCGACDNCLDPRGNRDGALEAQILLSWLYRIGHALGSASGRWWSSARRQR